MNDDSITANSIEAIIPETQTIAAGATIKLALSDDVTIKNVLLPAGTFLYGTASLSNERLKISISSIRFENSILPVALDVYDMDGQEGIYIPGSINQTVAKESANNAMSGMNATTIDPSIGAQAASAGIEAAKSLFSKKIRLVKMTVRAGYKVLLRDNDEK
jgi:conjugative transposon TraM protein